MCSKNYGEFVKSMTSTERIDWVEYHFTKYRKMGYDVGFFRSLSCITDENENFMISNRSFFHEYKTIDEMEEYLKNIKNE